jgi:TPR repeat protein
MMFLSASMIALVLALSPLSDRAEKLFSDGKDAEAFYLVQQGATTGDPELVEYLAWCYDEGRGVARDPARAVPLFRQSAEAGRRYAQWRLGVMLDEGDGVDADPVEAIGWFRKAVAQGSSKAHASMAVMFATGRGVAKDFAQSMIHYRAAAKLGDRAGFFGVGLLYSRAEGVPHDNQEGAAWILAAQALKDERTQRVLADSAFTRVDRAKAVQRANQILEEFGQESRVVRWQESSNDLQKRRDDIKS